MVGFECSRVLHRLDALPNLLNARTLLSYVTWTFCSQWLMTQHLESLESEALRSLFLIFLAPSARFVAVTPVFLDIAEPIFDITNGLSISCILANVITDFNSRPASSTCYFDNDVQRDRFLATGLLHKVVCIPVSLICSKDEKCCLTCEKCSYSKGRRKAMFFCHLLVF